ncbi:Tripartite tricarboxylate transporter family receptor [Variovorax boronicumulans]|uniref:Bug family tripartite tricarboxylate transporter substrate binding protein n=1 Tax=Variovorax boronicumulans TaxID=436515 RepID=UPI000BB3754B|nr:tripartite tricarboxylate transporter substrate binding protein [Variovorax boronicumulans]PBI87739.1 Tripartite tricarboxylate transporter family receptor [Variovorax boronicumulans]
MTSAPQRHPLFGQVSACLAIAASMLVSVAHAQVFPSRPITMVVPVAAGSGSDVIARAVANDASAILKQPIVIDNRPGAGGNIGTALVARARPDGYTLVMNSLNHVINPALYSKPGYDVASDFVPVVILGTGNIVLTVRGDSPIKDMKSFLEAARKASTPLTYATPGNGSVNHLATAMLAQSAGVKFQHIPFGGAPAASNALAAGQVDFAILAPASTIGMFQSGRLRAIGMTGQRIASMPDVPSIHEVLPGYEIAPWYGVFAPKGTPADVVAELHRAFKEAQARPDLKKKMEQIGIVLSSQSQGDFVKLMATEIPRWNEVVKHSGATVD